MQAKTQVLSGDENWMEPLKAVHLLSRELGGDRKAKKAITERLRDGAIESTAWWLAIGADVGLRPYIEPAIVNSIKQAETPTKLSAAKLDEIRRIKTRPTVSHLQVGDGLAFEVLVSSPDNNLMVGRQFWTSARKEDEVRWDWAQGFFIESGMRGGWLSTGLSKKITQKIPMRSFALGVRFRRSDIEKLLGDEAPAAVVAEPKPSKKSGKQSEVWPHWMAALAVMIYEDAEFSSARALVSKVNDVLTAAGIEPPSVNTTYPVAKAVIAALGESKLRV